MVSTFVINTSSTEHMESIKEIFKIGYGPSSSHTMAPRRAAELFKERNPGIKHFRVTLYGSLAATGKGHMTDKAITDALSPYDVEIAWEPGTFLPAHPNGMRFEALDKANNTRDEWITFSIGGGDLNDRGQREPVQSIYPLGTLSEILAWCEQNGRTLGLYYQLIYAYYSVVICVH